MKIKGQLADTGGEQYFQDQLKNSAVPSGRAAQTSAVPELKFVVVVDGAQVGLGSNLQQALSAATGGQVQTGGHGGGGS